MNRLVISFVVGMMFLVGCHRGAWVHKDGREQKRFYEDQLVCEKKANDKIKEQFGFDSCSDYAYEKGMEYPVYISSWSWNPKHIAQTTPVPNERYQNKALEQCEPIYQAILDNCIKDKGWSWKINAN
ncbi:MAG: hypothetical protein Q8K40_02220 [Ignavibacteria bacterium]|nr:hypothetical protein [Ignavibacteria bacterium]